MINGDDGKLRTISFHLNANSWLVKGSVDVVDGDWVVRVGGIAAHVAYNTELAVGRLEALNVHERRNWLREVDAVDEDIRLDDFRVWA